MSIYLCCNELDTKRDHRYYATVPFTDLFWQSCLAEHVFADSADRAYPVLRKILESCSGSDSVVRIAYCRIILISACITNILVHVKLSLYLCLPQSVEVAVLVNCHRCISFCYKELSCRFLTRLEVDLLITLLCLEDDELDVVGIHHRMCD